MTRTLYYEDPYQTSFTATIQRIEPPDAGSDGEPVSGSVREVVLDATAFYPEGGGQPADIGTIAGLPVTHVRKRDGEVRHRVEIPADNGEADREAAHHAADHHGAAHHSIEEVLQPGREVRGEVDWTHRHDFMQQHTGQHVISAAFVHTGSYPTISVHQGEEYTTIEINAEAVPTADLDAVEDRANAMVAADAAVRDYIVDEAEIPGLELRRPPKVSGSIRIVEIEGYDRVACGGVHLARTGEVGWIKLVDTERIRGRVRSVWKIGARAVADYRLKTRVAAELTDRLSVQVPEIPGRVAKMQERIAEREWEIEQLKRRIAGLIAERLAAEAESAEAAVTGDLREEDAELLRSVVEHVVETQSRPAALTAPQEGRLRWCIGLPAESTVDVNKARSELLEPIAGKGGGKPPYFQGIAEKPEGAEEFFRRFAELVRRS